MVVGGVVVGWFFSDYRVSPNFLVVLGLRLWLRLGLGCDNMKTQNSGRKRKSFWQNCIKEPFYFCSPINLKITFKGGFF